VQGNKLPPFNTIIQVMSDLEPLVTTSHNLSTSASKSSDVRSKKTAPLLLFLEEDRRLPILAPLSSPGKKINPARHEMLSVQPKNIESPINKPNHGLQSGSHSKPQLSGPTTVARTQPTTPLWLTKSTLPMESRRDCILIDGPFS